ncbi:hypothetical protein Patl1_30545 [Pistacia atlantica]|uniref:Uncharacterized protein n=1 Tax=Pistacia atlantica TaxID=434234 RepID=A0ACC1AA56_9ROSI|nr:hypothetical protein Patl1_30545 [Pistacia atlantica]
MKLVLKLFGLCQVDSVPDLTEHIHRTTARLLLHIDGYVDRISNAKWEVKELGLEHNGSVNLDYPLFLNYFFFLKVVISCETTSTFSDPGCLMTDMLICCWENLSTIKQGLLMEVFAKR